MTNFTVGVPYKNCPYGMIATREDEACAIAFGAWLAGKKPLVYMQNSGLGNCIDVITSLIKPYGADIEFIVENRNSPEHHAFMGSITNQIIEVIGLDKVTIH